MQSRTLSCQISKSLHRSTAKYKTDLKQLKKREIEGKREILHWTRLSTCRQPVTLVRTSRIPPFSFTLQSKYRFLGVCGGGLPRAPGSYDRAVVVIVVGSYILVFQA